MNIFAKNFILLNLIDIDIRAVGSSKTDLKKIDSAFWTTLVNLATFFDRFD